MLSGQSASRSQRSETDGFLLARSGGAIGHAMGWLRRNLFSTAGNTVLTLIVVALMALTLPPLFRWAVSNATISGTTRAACGAHGACWTFIRVHLPALIYGRYPADERWRVDLSLFLMAAFLTPVMGKQVYRRGIWLLLLVTLFPLLAGLLLVGGVAGLPIIDTSLWGGLMLNVVICFVTVAGSLPLGVVLAFGRRSHSSIVRGLSVAFIELWRGVPLLTVLFMSAVVAPLFLPQGVTLDRLVRAMAALVLFNSAYMAEVVRGGLQGVARGQEEAGHALGLRRWQVQAYVILPQALRSIMPGIINTVVDLFKDITLVTIIGLSDLLGAVSQALKDPAWLGFATEGYAFSAAVFFVCCFTMSAYGRSFERRIARST
jgi:general L-amino acid transport system permease protein